jgi:hypothetical protein
MGSLIPPIWSNDAQQTLIVRDASASPPDGAAHAGPRGWAVETGKRLDARKSTHVGHRQGLRCRREHCAARERTLLCAGIAVALSSSHILSLAPSEGATTRPRAQQPRFVPEFPRLLENRRGGPFYLNAG